MPSLSSPSEIQFSTGGNVVTYQWFFSSLKMKWFSAFNKSLILTNIICFDGNIYDKYWSCPSIHLPLLILGHPEGLLPVGQTLKTSPEKSPGCILTRCPSHLIWLLLTRSSNGSTQSSSRMAELLTFSLREIPAIIRRKLISANLTRDYLLLVNTKSLRPYIRVQTEINW